MFVEIKPYLLSCFYSSPPEFLTCARDARSVRTSETELYELIMYLFIWMVNEWDKGYEVLKKDTGVREEYRVCVS